MKLDCLVSITINIIGTHLILLIDQIAGTDKFIKVIDFLRHQVKRETLVGDFYLLILKY